MNLASKLGLAAALTGGWLAVSGSLPGCGANGSAAFDGDGGTSAGTGAATTTSASGGSSQGGWGFGGDFTDGGVCDPHCSTDFHSVLDCNGNVVAECTGLEGCDVSTKMCANACEAAANNKQSVGCEYYATDMSSFSPTYCFAAIVANTWNAPVHISVEYQGAALDVASFARIPNGQGPGLTYEVFDVNAGLPPGEVAILFLAGAAGGAPLCPVAGAVPTGTGPSGTAILDSFRIETDLPVVAYEINPFGGGSVAVTGASLLLPTSAWDTNYVAVNAYRDDISGPSMNIIAAEDATTVTMVPVAAVTGGGGVPSAAANTPFSFTLNRGQQAQIEQTAELTGSIIQSDKPVGLMAGHPCMRTPYQVAFCDHGEQMIPPVQALGHEYVGVMYRSRSGEPAIWRVIGAIDGTELTWSEDVGGPTTLGQGTIAEFTTATPFVVSSQDEDHPFLLFTYMSGSQWSLMGDQGGYGDVDFVVGVPPAQYMTHYVFFTDPTYPETNLVVVRAPVDGEFLDVTLDCAGVLEGWQTVGDYQWTRADLITGDFQGVGACSTGRHELSSDGPVGLWVWGWGTPLTGSFTKNVSYGYPGGMNVQPINTVVIPPIPH